MGHRVIVSPSARKHGIKDEDAIAAAQIANVAAENQLAQSEEEGGYTSPASQPSPRPEHLNGPRYTDSEIAKLLEETRGNH